MGEFATRKKKEKSEKKPLQPAETYEPDVETNGEKEATRKTR